MSRQYTGTCRVKRIIRSFTWKVWVSDFVSLNGITLVVKVCEITRGFNREREKR